MKLTLVFVFFFISFLSFAGVNKELGYNLLYRQKNYQLVDEQGDYALYTRVKMSPKAIYYTTIGNNAKYQKYLQYIQDEKKKYADQFDGAAKLMDYEEYQQKEQSQVDPKFFENLKQKAYLTNQQKEEIYADYLNNNTRFEGLKDPIKRDELVNALTQVMKEELDQFGTIPTRGEFHTWSKSFQYTNFDHFFPASTFSKLLAALALGRTYYYMITEKEEELVAWMLKQPYQSITLPELFRASYRLNSGDVYKTLLTIENLLSFHWMADNRENFGPILRLRPINNFYQNKGDKYGSWYHLFGVILYGHVQGGIASRFVSYVESIGSHIMLGEPEPQEDFINSAGGPIGAKIRSFVDDRRVYEVGDHPEYLKENYYLDLGEDFRPQLNFAHDSRFNIEMKKVRGSMNKESSIDDSSISAKITSGIEQTLENCLVEVFSIHKDNIKNRLLFNVKANFVHGKTMAFKYQNVTRNKLPFIVGLKAQISGCRNNPGVFRLSTKRFFPL